ncbi:MAG: SPASM domain-containing protein [Proteobacteria bacterium]|nr:SPASM domain-containing protein [Pseudomonadota bacterium]MBU4297584.1 SPASM domain-containing protein [Pseudomonadota bacterium]MCG2748850.1 SPASM domain-containing protein [Desulfobulbaceae bacterium]
MKKFKKIYIEITNHCNLSCSFCHKSNRPKAVMSPTVFADVVRQIRDHTDYLALHVLGEPLLHPQLGELLAICQHQGLRVNLTTNGTLLTRLQPVLFTSPALRQINISLHSVIDQQISAGINVQDYLVDIFSFMWEAIAATQLFISLRLWNMTKEEDGTNSRRNEYILKQLEAFFALPFRLADELTPGHGITLAPRVFLSQNQRFTWPHAAETDLGNRGFCRGLRDHVAILVDGTVVPCCLDAEADINLGNILSQPLGEILAVNRANMMRQGFSNRLIVEQLCRRCSYRQSF